MAHAWRPDGRVLAVQPVSPTTSMGYGQGLDGQSTAGPGAAVPDQRQVLLYDCQTGAQMAALTPSGGGIPGAAAGEQTLLAWSPTGSRLFLYDPTLGTATIWSPTGLPHG